MKIAAPRKTATEASKAKPAAKESTRAGKKTRLSKKELGEFREMLLAKRRTLLGDMSGMEKEAASKKVSGSLSRMPTDMADVGTDNFEHEFTLGLLESEQALLREIDAAVARVGDKTYGVCLGTGKPIPKARLRARPWAKYTVEYTRMLEKGLIRPRSPEDEEQPAGPEELPE